MNLRTIAFVFARGGSKGIPRKNLQELGGRPLIAHSIECGLAMPEVERVVVSTDDLEIAEVSKLYGAEVPFMRPSELAGDTSSEYLAWQHAIRAMTVLTGEFDIMLSLPATSPLRCVQDVKNCFNELRLHSEADAVITVQKASRNPYFNMVIKNEEGHCRIVNESSGYVRRQDAPEIFDITTVAYAAKTTYVLNSTSLFEGNLRCVEVPKLRALDIDEPLDLDWARFLYDK